MPVNGMTEAKPSAALPPSKTHRRLSPIGSPYDVYVASSWRNRYFPEVVELIRAAGLSAYDFREQGFSWGAVDPSRGMSPNRAPVDIHKHAELLEHPLAAEHFALDADALENAQATVVVLPCGRSAHLELGYAIAGAQHTAVYMPEPQEPELMYRYCDLITDDLDDVIEFLRLRIDR